MFCLCFCMSEVISSYRSLRAGSQVFALLMLFLCVIFAYYVFGQEPVVAMHLALWYVVLVCHQYDVCENSVGSVYVGGYGSLSESGLFVVRKLSLLSAQYLVHCLDTENVCHHITTLDHPLREMKETLFTRHNQTVLPLLANTKKASL